MLSTTRKTILVVDDEPAILGLVTTILTFSGYRVLVANGPREAIDIFRRASAVDLLLSDMEMPHMDGGSLAAHLVQLRPPLRVLLMTGSDRAKAQVTDERFQILCKPFSMSVLRELVSATLSTSAAAAPVH
jgi:DNA-binding NtrC family response regulator